MDADVFAAIPLPPPPSPAAPTAMRIEEIDADDVFARIELPPHLLAAAAAPPPPPQNDAIKVSPQEPAGYAVVQAGRPRLPRSRTASAAAANGARPRPKRARRNSVVDDAPAAALPESGGGGATAPASTNDDDEAIFAAIAPPAEQLPSLPAIDFRAPYAVQPTYVAHPSPPLTAYDRATQLVAQRHTSTSLAMLLDDAAAADVRLIAERQRARAASLRASSDAVPAVAVMRSAFADVDGASYASSDAVLSEHAAEWLLESTTQHTFATFFDAIRSPLPHERRCVNEQACFGVRVMYGETPAQILREYPPPPVVQQFAATRRWPAAHRYACLACQLCQQQSAVLQAMAEQRPLRAGAAAGEHYFLVDVPGGFSRYDCMQSAPQLYTGAFAPFLVMCVRHYVGKWVETPQGNVYQLYPTGLIRLPADGGSGDAAANFRSGPSPSACDSEAAPLSPSA
jgi:hypothetical protein